MTTEDIILTLKGQTVSEYNSFSGSNECFVVSGGLLTEHGNIRFYGEQGGRNYIPAIYISPSKAEQLILHGEVVEQGVIDHCHYSIRYSISPTSEQLMQNRIDNIKDRIKRLKQELKQAEREREDYLVSSIRISVARTSKA